MLVSKNLRTHECGVDVGPRVCLPSRVRSLTPPALRRSSCFLLLLPFVAMLLTGTGARAQEPAYQVMDVTDGGALTGRVRYLGDRTSKTIRVTRDADACGTEARSDHTIVTGENGGLANVIVSIQDITAGRALDTAPDADVEITRCNFQPHVTTVTLGGKLTLRNTDSVLHRPRGDIGEEPVFQWGMPLPQRLPKKIRQVGMIRIRCSLHPWARAWVGAFAHPYHTVTDATGAYHLADIPPGEYTLLFWHETFGEQSRGVTVEAGATATADVTFD